VVQIYPSRELTLVAGGRGIGDPRVEYVDDPRRVHLDDRAFAQLSYTLRCQLDTGKLKDVHNQFGPEGLWAALRCRPQRRIGRVRSPFGHRRRRLRRRVQ
jgi:hypothetical protein